MNTPHASNRIGLKLRVEGALEREWKSDMRVVATINFWQYCVVSAGSYPSYLFISFRLLDHHIPLSYENPARQEHA